MKNIKSFFLLAAAMLTVGFFASCAIDNNGGGNGEGEFDNAYFAVKMGLSTKALPTETGTDNEQMINGVYIMLYDATSGALNYGWATDITNINAGALGDFTSAGGNLSGDTPTSNSGQFLTIGREVQAKAYKLVIVANPGTKFATTFSGTGPAMTSSNAIYGTLAALQAAQDVVVADLGSTATGGSHFMSNANGPVSISASNLKATAAAAEAAPIQVRIDRSVAKVLVTGDANIMVVDHLGNPTAESMGTVESLEWRVNNVNTKSFLLRKYAYLSPEFNVPLTAEDEANSIYANRDYLYATDPNMDLATSSVAGTFSNESAYKNWFDESTDTGDPSLLTAHFTYVTENTLNEFDRATTSVADFKKMYTYIDIKAKVKFDKFIGVSGDNGYYSFNNGTAAAPQWVIFSWAEAKSWFADPTTVPWNMANLIDAIQELIDDDENTGIWDFQAADDEDPTVTHGLTTITASANVANNTIYFHPDGLNIYHLPIQHFGYDTHDYGYYGVVRNNVYKVNITKIAGPGATGAETGFLAADITVNPWLIRGQDHEITPVQ